MCRRMLVKSGSALLLGLLGCLFCGMLSGCVSAKVYNELKYERDKERTARLKAEESLKTLRQASSEKDIDKKGFISKIQGLEDENARLQEEISRLQKKIKDYFDNIEVNKVDLILTRSEKARGTLDLTINKSTGGVVLKHDMLFTAGTMDLTPESVSVLKALTAVLNGPDLQSNVVFIDGHTNNTPVTNRKALYPDNWALGARRAAQVRNHLQKLGIAPVRLVLRSYGYTVPLDPGKPDWPGNRRVEIVIGEKIK